MIDDERNHTLVLNKNWVAITVITSLGALVSMCRERSKAMCPNMYQLYDIEEWVDRSSERPKEIPAKHFIKTTRYVIEKPEIIILNEYTGVPFKQVNFTRHNLYKRDNYMCQYCEDTFILRKLTIDHVIPTSRGGQNAWNNCVTSCKECNSGKANKTPQEAGLKLFKKPQMPKWTPVSGIIPNKRPESWSNFLKM